MLSPHHLIEPLPLAQKVCKLEERRCGANITACEPLAGSFRCGLSF